MTPQKQILVVEDNTINRELLVDILSDRYAVLQAENGMEALEVLQKNKDSIALILLDVMMPVMDGYTFLSKIKQDKELALIPVIVTTQSGGENDEVDALAHGATDFVPKPYRPQVILHRVAGIINLRETAAMINQFKFDRLTGLYTKEFFCQRARELLAEHPDKHYAILSFNIENFKLYNDFFGTEAGSRLLCEVAVYGKQQIEELGLCGRITADRMVAMCEQQNVWNEDFFARHAAAINTMANLSGSVVVKFGAYMVTDPAVPVEQMCDRAMMAADSIKGQYNRCFAIYDDSLRQKLVRKHALTDVMESALADGQFAVYLQPKFSLSDGMMAGAEALVRWVHPEWGMISPGEFIPLFEKNGFITKMDQYVWEQVCILLHDWKEKGYPLLPVSVNVSRADIYRADQIKFLQELVQKYDIEPSLLHLEITESAYTENPGQIVAIVDRLRMKGFVIEMDDFGSGYSSLNMLGQMKMDILKLDTQFVQNELTKPTDQGILRFVVDLARQMNLLVVAEGVETATQMECLRQIGCDYAQGFFFAKPMPAPDFEARLRDLPKHVQSVVSLAPCEETGAKYLLAADEDPRSRALIDTAFASEYTVLHAENTEPALAAVTAHGRNLFAVLLSTTLPQQGADKVIDILRKNPATWHVPVLSMVPTPTTAQEAIAATDTDVVTFKPRDALCLGCLRRRVAWLHTLSTYQRRERVLREEANRDYLTGTLNRRGFQAAFTALQKEDLPLALYLFDLDDMKKVNDRFGHDAGDRMLREFGELLNRSTRSEDIVCRYGGDEFAVIIKRISSPDAILKKGNDICRGLAERIMPGGIRVTCTGGIVLCKENEKPTMDLLKQADTALYRAKHQSKGTCCICEQPTE